MFGKGHVPSGGRALRDDTSPDHKGMTELKDKSDSELQTNVVKDFQCFPFISYHNLLICLKLHNQINTTHCRLI